MKIRVFISYSRKDARKVAILHRFLVTTFDSQASFWLDNGEIKPGDDWEAKVSSELQHADLVVALLSPSACLSTEVYKEVDRAIQLGKTIIPVIIDAKTDERAIDKLHPQLKRFQYIRASGLRGVDELQQLLAAIRKCYEARFKGEFRMFQSIDSLLDDLVSVPTATLDIFLIDGGTTLRKFLRPEYIKSMLAHANGSLAMRCLFVNTACRNLLAESVAGESSSSSVTSLSDHDFSTIIEGVLQGSRWIHNSGPHARDLAESVEDVHLLASQFPGSIAAECRTVPVLPVNRLILTEHSCYIPAFFPLLDGLHRARLDYYALRFTADAHLYQVAKSYFEYYWDRGAVVHPRKIAPAPSLPQS